MNFFLKISKQTLWQTIVKIITTFSSFIILSIVARNYGELGTGSFTLSMTFLGLFYILADLAINAHILHKLQAGNAGEIWRKLLGARIIWSIFLSLGAGIVAFVLPYSTDFKLAVLVGLPTIIFFAINLTAHSLFQLRLRYDLDILPTFIGVSLGTLVIFIFSEQNYPIYALALGYVVAWLIHAVGTYLSTKTFIKNLKPILDFNFTKRLIIEASPLSTTLILNVIYFRVDSFILPFYHSLADVGIYNTAYQIFQAVLVLPTFMMNAFYPMMLESLKNNLPIFNQRLKRAALALLLVSLLISLSLYLTSGFIINLVTGVGFSGSITSLQILSLSVPAFFLSALGMWLMVAKKMYKQLVWIYSAGLVFNILANLIYIPVYSYLASSWITVISEYLILLLQLVVLLLL